MPDYATAVSLRSLTDEQREAIKYFYTPPSSAGLFLSVFLPVTLCLSIGSVFFSLVYASVIGISLSVFFVLLRVWRRRRRIGRATYVYEYGEEGQLEYNSISDNYGFKVNGAPQQVISLLLNGKPLQVKTFNPNLVTVYTIPRQAAYTHPRYPGVTVPAGLFRLQPVMQPRTPGRAIKAALTFIIPLAFVFGLTFFINHEMDSSSSTHAQPDARIYRQGGQLVMATVATHFQAYEVSNKGTYGNNSWYAEGIDMATGRQLWKTGLDAKNSDGGSSGGARLLGQSDRYLFFLRNELYVIDKQTGKTVARNDNFTAIKDKMSRALIASYEDDAAYTYNDSMQVLVVKGTDGLYYTIDGRTLQTGRIDIADPDTYFKNRYRYGNNYEDQITALSDDGHRCLALLDAKDTVLLAHNAYGVNGRPAAESVRRTLYSCSATELSDGWKTLSPSIFLFGGFLADGMQRLAPPQSVVSRYASYQSLANRYNYTNPAMRTGGGAFIIMHKSSIEQNALLLLTCVSATGTTLWEVSTGYGSAPLIYKDDVADRLYLAGDAGGGLSDELNQVLAIDLKSGAVQKYSIK